MSARRVSERPAVFLDRDGTLVRDRRHGAEPALMRLLPGVVPALRALSAAGYALVVVTNQSGLARGLFDEGEALAMGRRLAALLGEGGPRLAGYYLAPNHPAGEVESLAFDGAPRKPDAGLLRRAAADLGLDLARSWMLGDNPSDVEAGRRAGARCLLLDTGALAYAGLAQLPASLREPGGRLMRNLPHAAAHILRQDGHLRLQPELAAPSHPVAVELDLAPLPIETLLRAERAPDERGPGAPSRWPDAARLAAAAAEGQRLASICGLEIGASPAADL